MYLLTIGQCLNICRIICGIATDGGQQCRFANFWDMNIEEPMHML